MAFLGIRHQEINAHISGGGEEGILYIARNTLFQFAGGGVTGSESVTQGDISVAPFHHGERRLSLTPSLTDENLLPGDSLGIQ